MITTLKEESISLEPEDSANYIWDLLKAGNIDKHISNTEKCVENIQEKINGKGQVLKGASCVVAKGTAPVITIFAAIFPQAKAAVTVGGAVVATTAGLVSNMASQEVQDHPFEATAHGAKYVFDHTRDLLNGHKTPDTIIESLEIARKHALENENADNELSQSGPKV